MLSTNNSAIEKILQSADFIKASKFYDLGSGNGKVTYHIAHQFPELECVGIELNLVSYLLSRLRNVFLKHKVSYRREDFFKTYISDADIIYAYLFPKIMEQLEEKFDRELKKGAIVIVNAFPLKHKDPKTVIGDKLNELSTLYIYEY